MPYLLLPEKTLLFCEIQYYTLPLRYVIFDIVNKLPVLLLTINIYFCGSIGKL